MLSFRDVRYLAPQLLRKPGQARHLPSWIKASSESPVGLRLPWLAYDVIAFLDTVVTPTARVFEFGGGGSTLWFADRAREVVTVEHDPAWARDLITATETNPHVRVLVRAPDHEYAEYVSAIEQYPTGYFDMVVVDGRERVRCTAAARERIRPGGYLVLDDAERERYRAAHALMSDWPGRTFTGMAPFKPIAGTTTVWRRPNDPEPA